MLIFEINIFKFQDLRLEKFEAGVKLSALHAADPASIWSPSPSTKHHQD